MIHQTLAKTKKNWSIFSLNIFNCEIEIVALKWKETFILTRKIHKFHFVVTYVAFFKFRLEYIGKIKAHKKHNGKYVGHSFGWNRSQNLLRFEMYEIIEFWSKLGWNNLFVPQNLRVLLISLRHIMYCFVFHGPYDSPLTLNLRTSRLFSLLHR